MPIQNLLIYGTGGLAFGHVNGSSNQDFRPQGPAQYLASVNTTLPGWAVGAGVEWLIAPHWSFSGEYLYNQLENQTVIGNPVPADPPYQNQYNIKNNYNLTELALNYRF